MTPEDFTDLMAKLRDCFGEKSFNEQRCQRIFKFSKHLTYHQFDELCIGFIDGQRIAPLPLDFLLTIRAKGWSSHDQKAADFMATNCKFGHTAHSKRLEELQGACLECLRDGYLPEVIEYPYLTAYIPKELGETAKFFRRQAQESLQDYARRTWKQLREVQRSYGLIPKDFKGDQSTKDSVIDMVKALASGKGLDETVNKAERERKYRK